MTSPLLFLVVLGLLNVVAGADDGAGAAGPSDAPSLLPSGAPSFLALPPSDAPSLLPSSVPSAVSIPRSDAPSLLPSTAPSWYVPISDAPSLLPSTIPTAVTIALSDTPSLLPSAVPSAVPIPRSDAPSLMPSTIPSLYVPIPDSHSLLPSVAPPPSGGPTNATNETSCTETTFWVYESPSKKAKKKRNSPALQITNNTAVCLSAPYNIEVRPCGAPSPAAPGAVQVRIVRAYGGRSGRRPRRRLVHESAGHRRPPYFLYGPTAVRGDGTTVRSSGSRRQLPNGLYYVSASPRGNNLGRLVFTQRCAPNTSG